MSRFTGKSQRRKVSPEVPLHVVEQVCGKTRGPYIPRVSSLPFHTRTDFDLQGDVKKRRIAQEVLTNLLLKYDQGRFFADAATLSSLMRQPNTPFTKWLRGLLLRQEESRSAVGCWSVYQPTFDWMWGEVMSTPVVDAVTGAWRDLLHLHVGGAPIVYRRREPWMRGYHDLQLLPRRYKSHLFRGLTEFDISTAAPSILIQRASQQDPTYTPTHALAYIANKGDLRGRVATTFNLHPDDSKGLITKVLSLAKFEAHVRCSIFRDLGCNLTAFNAFIEDEQIRGLRADMEWAYATLCDTPGSGSARFRTYELYEQEVMQFVHAYLNKLNLPHLLQHDGWLHLSPITNFSIHDLQASIFTNFSINLNFDRDDY